VSWTEAQIKDVQRCGWGRSGASIRHPWLYVNNQTGVVDAMLGSRDLSAKTYVVRAGYSISVLCNHYKEVGRVLD